MFRVPEAAARKKLRMTALEVNTWVTHTTQEEQKEASPTVGKGKVRLATLVASIRTSPAEKKGDLKRNENRLHPIE